MGAVIVGDDRLNAELKLVGLCRGGDAAAGLGAGFDDADAKSLKPSSPKRSAGIAVAAGFGAGGDAGC